MWVFCKKYMFVFIIKFNINTLSLFIKRSVQVCLQRKYKNAPFASLCLRFRM
jgi:hypothetical protein